MSRRLHPSRPPSLDPCSIPEVGLEPGQETPEKTTVSEAGGAECGAQRAPEGQFEPDLQRLIDAWPTLPDALKTGIAAMVEAAAKSDGEA